VNILLAGSDFLVLFAYLLLLLVVGFSLGRKDGKTDIFLGGRSLRWWQIGFSLFSANAGPMMLVGAAGLGFSQGIVGSNFEWLAWIFLLLLAWVFLPHYMSTRVTTMPQFLQLRYGKRSYRFLIIYSLISILLVWLGSALYAGGLLISKVFGWSLMQAVLVVAVIATSFTAAGGLKAVVRTGIFQSVIIIVSSVLLTFLALDRVGGIGKLMDSLPSHYWELLRPSSDPEYSWVAILAGYPVVAIYYWCADQTIVQKALAARDLKEGQKGILFLGVLKIVTPVLFIFPGMICFVLFKDITGPDNAYITMVIQLMPHGLLGLCVAALIAALIDTVSSGLNSFSAVFTLDVIGQFVTLDDAAKRRTGKWLTMGGAVLAVLVAYLYSFSGKGLFELTQGLVSILAPPLSVVFLGGVLWKRVTSLAAETVLYGGGVICLVVGICYLLNFPYRGFWPHFLLLSVYLFLFLSGVLIALTLWAKPDKPGSYPSLFETGISWRHNERFVWMGWGALALVMGIIYLTFR